MRHRWPKLYWVFLKTFDLGYEWNICDGCFGFEDFPVWVIDLGPGFLWVSLMLGWSTMMGLRVGLLVVWVFLSMEIYGFGWRSLTSVDCWLVPLWVYWL